MSFAVKDKPVEILLVNDNLADVKLIKETLKERKVPRNLHTVNDVTALQRGSMR